MSIECTTYLGLRRHERPTFLLKYERPTITVINTTDIHVAAMIRFFLT